MLDEYVYGRKDAATESECQGSFPATWDEGIKRLEAAGFTPAQIVALANVEAFNVVRDPEQERWSTRPRFDNYYYQQLLSSSRQDLPLQKVLTGTQEYREVVEKFAEDKNEWDAEFKPAFCKLMDLGSQEKELTDIEYFIQDDPKFILAKKQFEHRMGY